MENNNIFKKINKINKLNLWQKLSVLFMLIMAIVCFVYALSFSTNWAIFGEAGDYPPLYIEAQKLNVTLFNLSLYTLIMTVLAFLFGSYKHNKYYTYNYVLITISIILFIILLVVMGSEIPRIKSIYIRDVPIIDKSITEFSQLSPLEKKWYIYFLNSNSTYSLEIFKYGFIITIVSIISVLFTVAYVTYIFITKKAYNDFKDLFLRIFKKEKHEEKE